MPLALECKTFAGDEPIAQRSLVTTTLTSAVQEDEIHAGLHTRFAGALGLLNAEPLVAPHRLRNRHRRAAPRRATGLNATPAAGSRQEAEMLGRVRYLAETLVERPASQQQWAVMRGVLRRTLATGWAADVAERGLVIGAASAAFDRAAIEKRLTAVKPIAADCGCPVILNSTANFARQDALSGLVPPIALWPLTAYERGAILSEQVVMTVHQGPDLWERALAD